MTSLRERVVITGLGAVTPIGTGVSAFTSALRAGRSGVRLLESDPRMKSTVAARVWDDVFDPGIAMDEMDLRRVPRLVPMALAAAREAMEQAGFRAAEQQNGKAANGEGRGEIGGSRRIGLILGTGAGGIDFTLDQFHAVHRGKNASLWTITNATHGNLAGELSIRLGLRGPSWCVSTGCASASDAVGLALTQLRAAADGPEESRLDAMVVVGADAHVRWETLAGMELLKVITTRDWREGGEDPATASRPFDATRDGFVLGEGAWAAVLEREEAARRRETRALGEVMGYGATCDAYHRVRPAPDMEESARAMRMAIADAGVRPAEIEVLHYHGTSTKLNDAAETDAVKMVFGAAESGGDGHARRLVGTSVKSMIGHPQGACGLASLVATLGALTDQDGGGGAFVPPTINLRHPDPECDLDYTPNRAVLTRARTALINCLAFGAKNSALVVRAAD